MFFFYFRKDRRSLIVVQRPKITQRTSKMRMKSPKMMQIIIGKRLVRSRMMLSSQNRLCPADRTSRNIQRNVNQMTIKTTKNLITKRDPRKRNSNLIVMVAAVVIMGTRRSRRKRNTPLSRREKVRKGKERRRVAVAGESKTIFL